MLKKLSAAIAVMALLALLMPVLGAERTLVAGCAGGRGRGFSRRLRAFPGRLAFRHFTVLRFL